MHDEIQNTAPLFFFSDKRDEASGSSGFSKALTGRSIASTQSVLPQGVSRIGGERCEDAKATRSQRGSDWM